MYLKSTLSKFLLLVITIVFSSYTQLTNYRYDQIITSSGYYYKFNNTPELYSMLYNLQLFVKIEEGGYNFNDNKVITDYSFPKKENYSDEEYNVVLNEVSNEIKHKVYFLNIKTIKGIYLEKFYGSPDRFKLVIVYF